MAYAEYEAGSSVFVSKIKTVEASYRAIRRARGDGNCFFRSFVFAYMEQLVNLQDLPERNRSACQPCDFQPMCILSHLDSSPPVTMLNAEMDYPEQRLMSRA